MVTIKDIAKAAGVTIATVSRALNQEPGVHANTRKKIVALAKEMNYVPNMAAKRLVDRQSNCIGIIWESPKGLFFNHLCNEIQARAYKRGYSTLVSFAEPDTAMQLLNEHFVDRILYWCAPAWVPSLDFLKSRQLFRGKMLLVGGGRLEGAHRLAVDRKEAVFNAVKHLAELGHKRISFVGAATDKLEGFTLGLLEHQMTYNAETSIISYRQAEGFPEAKVLRAISLDKGTRPTAFIVDNHRHLFPFIQFFRKHRLRVPEDVSLIVYDSIPEMEQVFDVPLTTVGPDLYALAQKAVDLLLEDTADGGLHDMTLPSELIARASVLPAAAYE